MQRKIKLLTIGKVKHSWIDDGIREYAKRIPGLTITELRDSQKRTEWSEITPHIKTQDCVIVLTERGKLYNSIDFAAFIEKTTLDHTLLFVIGSSDGITPELERSAHHPLALSPMTFTHDMARLLLVEQIYRATSILSNGNYHK